MASKFEQEKAAIDALLCAIRGNYHYPSGVTGVPCMGCQINFDGADILADLQARGFDIAQTRLDHAQENYS